MSLLVDVVLPVTAIPPGGVVTMRTDVLLELERVVPTEHMTHYLWLVGENYQSVLDELRDESAVESVTTLDEYDDRVLVRLHWSGLETPFLELLDERDVVLVDAQGTADGWNATLRVPDEAALGTFYETSQQRGLGVEFRAINGARFDDGEDTDSLSALQRETLEAAFEAGYFDIPRSVTIAGLAAQLDRSEQAVSEALRRAMATHLRRTLQQQELDAEDGDADPDESPDGPATDEHTGTGDDT